MQLGLDGKTKDVVAIERLIQFCPPEGYYFADSYGKDSTVVRDLLERSGCHYEGHYARTGIDPPELVWFGRKNHPNTVVEKPKMNIWDAMVHPSYGMLPQRQRRWCCELLKEPGGSGRYCVTGVRWQESPKRAKRKMVEICARDSTKWYVNPIIDWTEQDVWNYIKERGVSYCSLYDERYPDGRRKFHRLGCILCPMGGPRQTQLQLKRWPELAEAWHRSTVRMYERFPERFNDRWSSPEELWKWWLSRKGEPKVSDAQCVLFT